jgi:uncharacterized Ntn-hydrolase superfamily protein
LASPAAGVNQVDAHDSKGGEPMAANATTRICPILLGLLLTAPLVLAAEPIATFSIVGFDPVTGDLGVAVQSKFFAVGSVVPYAKAGVGAIASQAFGNTTFGPRGLALLEGGHTVTNVLDRLLGPDSLRQQRQVGIVDGHGNSAAWTGTGCMAWAGHRFGPNYSAQGNILAGAPVVAAMADEFLATEGMMLGERLMRALEAGQAQGGDSRGMQSAAILIVREGAGYAGYNDRYCDLRVDDSPDPIAELRRIFGIWKMQALINDGYLLCDKQEYEKAIAYGREAIQLSPDSGEPHYHLACFLSRARRHDAAFDELRLAVGLDPSFGPRARRDPDFKPHYDDRVFQDITGPQTEK